MCGPCANFRQIQQQIVDQIDLSACSETRGLQYATGPPPKLARTDSTLA